MSAAPHPSMTNMKSFVPFVVGAFSTFFSVPSVVKKMALRGQAAQQPRCPPEPGTLLARLKTGHGRPLIENPLCPLPGLVFAVLGGEKCGVVVLRLGKCGNLRHLLEQRVGLFRLPGQGVSLRPQALGAVVTVLGIQCRYPLQIGNGG